MQQNTKTGVIQDRSKRRFILALSTLIGGATASQLLGGNAVSVALAYTPNPNSTGAPGKLFSQADMLMLRDICALVIPKTETLGAAEVDVHGFIDNQLFHCFAEDEQQQAQMILLTLNAQAKQRHSQFFSRCTATQQLLLLTDLEQARSCFDAKDKRQFKQLKELVIFGYYTSEVGATQEQAYLPVPGGFKGSIPYDSVGKAWTPLGF
ncbi:MAG: hypothetical protein ACI88A_000746 [Paraglaciecola sp.]|jgi:hypothetical protein